MKDEDGDGWGSNDVGEHIEMGGDCDDNDSYTYPGSAEKTVQHFV